MVSTSFNNYANFIATDLNGSHDKLGEQDKNHNPWLKQGLMEKFKAYY
jgi:hypothetical protein